MARTWRIQLNRLERRYSVCEFIVRLAFSAMLVKRKSVDEGWTRGKDLHVVDLL